jgi:hypothetical protein
MLFIMRMLSAFALAVELNDPSSAAEISKHPLREYTIKLTSSSNAQRFLHATNFRLIQVTRVCDEAQINTLPISCQPSRYIFAAKTISHAADALEPQFSPHVIERGLDDAIDFGWGMLGDPFSQIQAGFLFLDGNSVAREEIGHDDQVVVCGDGVGKELVFKERNAENVGYVDDGFGRGGGVWRLGDVCVDLHHISNLNCRLWTLT